VGHVSWISPENIVNNLPFLPLALQAKSCRARTERRIARTCTVWLAELPRPESSRAPATQATTQRNVVACFKHQFQCNYQFAMYGFEFAPG